MKNLLKHDFYRIFHSKLALISIILASAFALVVPLVFFGLDALVKLDMGVTSSADTNLFGPQLLFGLSYSLGSNIGIVIPIFGAIFIINDIRQGSTRNKIIRGYKKIEIFSSQSIVTICYVLTLITVYAVLTFLFSCLFFGFPDFTNVSTLGFFGQVFLMGTIEFIFASSLVIFGAYVTKNVGITILISIAFAFIVSLLASLLPSLPNADKYKILFDFIPTYGSSELSGLGQIASINPDADIEITLPVIDAVINGAATFGFAAINCFLGYLVFSKKDVN